MAPIILTLLTFFSLYPRMARAQITNATCNRNDDNAWLFNVNGESPWCVFTPFSLPDQSASARNCPSQKAVAMVVANAAVKYGPSFNRSASAKAAMSTCRP